MPERELHTNLDPVTGPFNHEEINPEMLGNLQRLRRLNPALSFSVMVPLIVAACGPQTAPSQTDINNAQENQSKVTEVIEAQLPKPILTAVAPDFFSGSEIDENFDITKIDLDGAIGPEFRDAEARIGERDLVPIVLSLTDRDGDNELRIIAMGANRAYFYAEKGVIDGEVRLVPPGKGDEGLGAELVPLIEHRVDGRTVIGMGIESENPETGERIWDINSEVFTLETDGEGNVVKIIYIDQFSKQIKEIVGVDSELKSTPSAEPTPAPSGLVNDLIVLLTQAEVAQAAEPEPTEVEPAEEAAAIVVNPDNPYYFNFSVSQEEIDSASGESLLELAPKFQEGLDYTKLGFREGEVTSLSKSGEVVKIGNNKLIPYENQEGDVVVGWDVEKGEMVHLYRSVYTDSQTGITVNSYVYTDNEWARDNNTWWEKQELSEGDLSKAFFDYPLALNYMWKYHQEEFRERLNLKSWENIDRIWVALNEKLSLQEIESFQARALQLFRQEINGRIESGDEVKLQMGRMGDLKITESNIDVFYKINYGGPYLMRSFTIPPFGDYGNIRVETGLENQVAVNINSDRHHRNEWGRFWVGDFVTHALRGMTAGGYTITKYQKDNKRAAKSLADNMMFDVCGQETMERYLSSLGEDYLKNRSVPLDDLVSPSFPTCLATERRTSN